MPVEHIDDDYSDGDPAECPDCGLNWDSCECQVGADCGRWRNGQLSRSCSKAGSEECDFECPHRDSLYRTAGVIGKGGDDA